MIKIGTKFQDITIMAYHFKMEAFDLKLTLYNYEVQSADLAFKCILALQLLHLLCIIVCAYK